MTSFDLQLEQARIVLHEEIERNAKEKFYVIEWWHVWRTTGMFIIRKEENSRQVSARKHL